MYCEKMHATITVATCLARQRKPLSALTQGAYLECRNCEQGRLAKAGKLNDKDVILLRTAMETTENKDDRRQTRDDRGQTAEGDKPMLCKICGEREADHPVRNEWCRTCARVKNMNVAREKKRLARIPEGATCALDGCNEPARLELKATGEWYCCRSHKDKGRRLHLKQNANQAPPPAGGPEGEPGTAARPVVPEAAPKEQKYETDKNWKPYQLTIDFGKHRDLLKKLEEVAEDEVRTPEQQTIYILRKHLCHIKGVTRCACGDLEVKKLAD